MSDESTAPADLSSLGIDLSDMFRPAWTTETTDGPARLAAKFDEGDRPERFGGGGRDGRRPRPERGQRTEERRDGGRQGRGPGQDNRGPRGGGPRENRGPGGPRQEGGRDRNDRGDRRGPREERDRRPEPAPKPVLEGWKLQLVPEPVAIEGIARQIRSRAKAYPLFELARLIVQLSDRYSVKLKAESEETPELFRAKADGSVWQTRKEAVSHLLSKHLEKFYRKSSVTTEAPKGAFAVVAQCGMSGVLLGPPNHHEYTTRLISLHAERFRNMPFEAYKSRIRMMRDEALIEQWKTEQSTKTVFIPITGEAAEPEVLATENAPETVADTAEAVPPLEAAQAPTEVPAGAPVENLEAAIDETATNSDQVSAEAPSESAGEESPAEEAAPAVEGAQSQGEEGLTWEQVLAHFNEHHAAAEIETSGRDITLKGGVALHGSSPLLRELLLKNLQEMDRFPLPLAQALGKELTNRGLQLFKSHKKIINVSVARPRYLDRETTPIGESFKAILEYLEAHPKQHRDKQWAALLALRTETVDQPASVEPSPAETQETSVTEKAAMPGIDEETLKRREQALGADLIWLLHQGHVIDFAMGNLQAATRPVPKTTSTPAHDASATPSNEAKDQAQTMDATLTGDTGDVQQGGSAATILAAEQSADVIVEPVANHEPLENAAGTVIAPPPSELGDPGAILPN